MADRRISHGNIKLACYSRRSSSLEQMTHHWPEVTTKTKTCWATMAQLELAESHSDLALINMAIDSKLRGCDLVKMKVVDVMASGQIKERASVLQSKTQKPVRFEISDGIRASVEKWLENELMVGSEYLWPGRFHKRLYVSTRQYARIVRDWVTSIGLEASAYCTHSIRRTKVAQIYKKTGNLRVVQPLLGHSKMDSTSDTSVLSLRTLLRLRKPLKSNISDRFLERPRAALHLKAKRCGAASRKRTLTCSSLTRELVIVASQEIQRPIDLLAA